MGHPFNVGTEVPVERVLSDVITAYGFHTKWLYTDLSIVPDEPFEAIVLWDPGWIRTGEGAGAIDELRKLWELGKELDVPLIGVYSDWFASWNANVGLAGTLTSLMYCDAIITDPAGAASLRLAPPMRITDPVDARYRPIQVMSRFLTYGRLPNVGAVDFNEEVPPLRERTVDVSMVSTMHPQHVVLRPYYVNLLRDICEKRNWNFEFRDRATPSEMEELYLNSRVVVNISLGTQLNYRVYEALACGALLVTDDWNIGLEDVPCYRFNCERSLHKAMDDAITRSWVAGEPYQRRGVEWAQAHAPHLVWDRILNECRDLAPMTKYARGIRNARDEVAT